MEYQYRPPKNQEEIEKFKELRRQSMAGRGIQGRVTDNADDLPGASFFIAIDENQKVVGGLRLVTQPYNDQHSLPTIKRLGLDARKLFEERGVEIEGKIITDMSGVHFDEQTVKQNPGLVLPLLTFAYNHAKQNLGADITMMAPSLGFDRIVRTTLKRSGDSYADLGECDMVFSNGTEHKRLFAASADERMLGKDPLGKK